MPPQPPAHDPAESPQRADPPDNVEATAAPPVDPTGSTRPTEPLPLPTASPQAEAPLPAEVAPARTPLQLEPPPDTTAPSQGTAPPRAEGVPQAEPAPRQVAGELARMGISPGSLGLAEPGTITLPPDPGGAAVPAAAGPPPHLPAADAGELPGMNVATGWVPATALTRPLTEPLTEPLTGPTTPAGPPPAAPASPPTPFAERFGMVVPAGWRRLVRTATIGLLAPGAAEAMASERRLVARVRSRLTEPRTVLFVAGKGGVGTTTTAIGVSHTLATLRTDRTVLVDGRSGTQSLGERATEMRAPTTLDLANDADHNGPLAFRNRLHLVDAPPWHLPLDPSRLSELLLRLRDEFHVIGVDAGNDIGQAGLVALSHADRVVLVTGTGEDCVPAIQVALGRVQYSRPSLVDSVVTAVVDTARRGTQRTTRALHRELGFEPDRVVGVPYDAALVAGGRFDPDRLRTATREAYLRLAALLAEPGARP